ncbi:hypothetical protein BaRGS_00003524 [Batillaria attramentaria]|uniref:Uncharacterized protein n=1 Tax=Batillaria attramentaria TaxID=370345 RepID=A0ABD0M2C4_9CAEN
MPWVKVGRRYDDWSQHLAAAADNTNTCCQLLTMGMKVDSFDPSGNTPGTLMDNYTPRPTRASILEGTHACPIPHLENPHEMDRLPVSVVWTVAGGGAAVHQVLSPRGGRFRRQKLAVSSLELGWGLMPGTLGATPRSS